MRELVERNKILEFVSGSNLYGTNIETSDKDYKLLFVADKQFYLGLEKVEEVDLSIVSKSEDGKNDLNAVDRTATEFRKAIRLIADGNPNSQEIIQLDADHNKDSIIFVNDIGIRLLSKRDLFVSKLVKQRFIGYSISQLHKARQKPDSHKDLVTFKEIYENTFNTNLLKSTKLIEFKFNNHEISLLIKYHQDFATIGSLNFNLNVKMSDVYQSICERIKKASHRSDGWLSHGVDNKFMMHCCRLLFEGKELLETGRIEFPLKQKDLLLDIRNGKLSLQEINELAEQLKKELENYKSDLPATPDFNAINSFLIDTVEEFWSHK